MTIICAAWLCLGDIKLFTSIIGFFPEQISTHAQTRRLFHFVLNFLFALGTGGRGHVFSSAHLRHSWSHAFLHI